MKATDFEFRNRWWISASIYSLGFLIYALRDKNSVQSLLEWMARHHEHQWVSRPAFHWAFGIGAALTIMSALLRSWASAYLGGSVVHNPGMKTDRLVADGPYRYLRNPLYLGNILLAIGFAFLASRGGAIVLIAGNVIFILRLISREEAGLLATQGEPYREYLRAVPRLWPALIPRLTPGNVQPRWLQGFVSECMTTWGFAAAVTVFAITFRLRDFSLLLAVGLLGGIFVNLHAARKAAEAEGR
jgi:protein-S-isoprenylcysteine O-methyltransferase Ste14